jgi:hypothetical protein
MMACNASVVSVPITATALEAWVEPAGSVEVRGLTPFEESRCSR